MPTKPHRHAMSELLNEVPPPWEKEGANTYARALPGIDQNKAQATVWYQHQEWKGAFMNTVGAPRHTHSWLLLNEQIPEMHSPNRYHPIMAVLDDLIDEVSKATT